MKVYAYLLKLALGFGTEIPEDEMNCIQRTVYHEARGESFMGQVLVAEVIENRINSSEFPNTACEVVSQKNQFSGNMSIPKNPESAGLLTAGLASRIAFSKVKVVNDFEEVYWFTQTGEPSRFHKNLTYKRHEGAHSFFHR